jgi:hypothetical protein
MTTSPENLSSATVADTPSRPWYRQFWPWFIMALPAAAVAASVTTLVIAVRHQDSLVRDDWYQEGKSINVNMARDQKAKTAHISAGLRFDSLTGEVRADLQSRVLLPDTLTLTLSHVTLADRDQTVLLKRQQDGHYQGVLHKELQGDFDVELASPEWRIDSSENFPRASVQLKPD